VLFIWIPDQVGNDIKRESPTNCSNYSKKRPNSKPQFSFLGIGHWDLFRIIRLIRTIRIIFLFYSHKTRGIIIKRRKYGEADHILTIFTEDLGRIQVRAQGVRRGKSRLAGILELFNLVQLEIIRGKIFDIVIGARILNSFLRLKSDYKKVSFAHFLAEFIDKFTEEREKDKRLYILFRSFFLNLDKFSDKDEYLWTLATGEWQMLEYLGVMPQLDYCVGCGCSLQNTKSLFLGEGGLYCGNCVPKKRFSDFVDREVLKILSYCRGGYVYPPARFGQPHSSGVKKTHRFTPTAANLEKMVLMLAHFLSASLAPQIKSLHFLKNIDD